MRLLAARERFNGHNMLFARVLARDTYVVSFPRSGSTWLRCMLTTLVHGTAVTPALVAETVPDVHRSNRSRPRHRGSLIVKSHTPFVEIPAKVIYLVRDGRDATLSFHYLQIQQHRLPADADPRVAFFGGDPWPCHWHEHASGWLDGLAGRDADRHLVVRYEDLLAEPSHHLAAIARLAGLPASASDVERAVRLNARHELQAIERAGGAGSLNHLGRGRPDWRVVLSAADRRRYEAFAGPTLARLGYPLEFAK
jgi:estrone sulfotransferase